MPIHIFERFDDTGKGDKWQDIIWDFARPTSFELGRTSWVLKCDFRLPHRGCLYIPHPTDDSQAIEFEYDLPTAKIPKYTPGAIKDSSFTEELKKEWEALPIRQNLVLSDRVSLVCKKEIVDVIEHSIDGYLYLYRPTELHVNTI